MAGTHSLDALFVMTGSGSNAWGHRPHLTGSLFAADDQGPFFSPPGFTCSLSRGSRHIHWLGVRRDPPRSEREESMELQAEAGKGAADLKRVYMPNAFVDVLCNPPPSQFPLPFSPLFSPAFLLPSRDCTQASCEAGYFSPTEPQYPQHLPHGVNWNHLLVRGFSRVGH